MSYTVLKFGGTSVGSPERMREITTIIHNCKEKKLVVLSAVSGTTNQLVEFNSLFSKNKMKDAKILLDQLLDSYHSFISNLFQNKEYLQKGKSFIESVFNSLYKYLNKTYLDAYENKILAQGELISTQIYALFLKELGVPCYLLSALDYMRLDENYEPNTEVINHDLNQILKKIDEDIIITQGYICRNKQGAIDNLKRGGSDYSASLIGAAINAKEIQIWTDIDGIHNNDPRIVEKTFPIAQLSFDEAAELSYFGAKVLHPACIQPAKKANIPVRILNTLKPEAKGTFISMNSGNKLIKAIAAKDDITAIRINSSRMLLAYGFMTKIFEVFQRHKTSVDMVTTSEVAVSSTIDDITNLDLIVKDLSTYGTVSVDKNKTIIAIVGKDIVDQPNLIAEIFKLLGEFHIRMISYGGSRNNISLLINSENKKELMEKLNDNIFTLQRK